MILRRPPANRAVIDQCLDDYNQAFLIGVPLEERMHCGGKLVPQLDALLTHVTPNRNMMWPDLDVLFNRTGYGWMNLSSGVPAVLSNGTFSCVGPLYTDFAAMPQVGQWARSSGREVGGRID